jgi:lipid-A-disaccharide synthase
MASQEISSSIRIGMVAGEKSGDNLGAGFIREMLRRYPDARFEGIGGPAMIELGLVSLFPMERLSVMGFIEPLGRLPELLTINRQLKSHFINDPPDVFIGIDSPGFNTQFERYLRNHGIKTVHYVSPSVWAYGEKRINKIRQAVDLMLVLFPFEQSIYQSHDIPVECVGHPLADTLRPETDNTAARNACGISTQDKLIALLPGSRMNEVKRLAPLFLRVAQRFKELQYPVSFVLPCATAELRQYIEGLREELGCGDEITLLDGQSQTAIRAADLVLLASGTATLEAMLLGKPMVICYQVAKLTYLLASRMLKVPYVGLPNLLAGERLVPEYLQHQATLENVFGEVEKFLADQRDWELRLQRFGEIHRELARAADKRAVDAVLSLLHAEPQQGLS